MFIDQKLNDSDRRISREGRKGARSNFSINKANEYARIAHAETFDDSLDDIQKGSDEFAA